MKTLELDLGSRSYPIFIGRRLLGQAELLTPYIKGRQALIVTNDVVGPLYLERVKALLRDFQCETVVLPDGEIYKNMNIVGSIFDTLLEKQFERSATLIALGGGVVGDMCGFAAACYQRGVPFIQIPTTLLAQVDSSVGGKTGVNHPLGKNMIGAFYQPRCVLIDTDTLMTLDERQLSAGLAEVVKYGLLGDAKFFTWLERNSALLLERDPEALAYAIERSCRNKARIVAEDEREAGRRALLNLGHTFGHAIETGMGYGRWLHGEAVAVGMCLAAEFSARMGWLDAADVERSRALLEAMGLPTKPPAELNPQRFMNLMKVDKKVQAGKVRFVLLKAIGEAVICDDYPRDALMQMLSESISGGA